MKKYLNLAILLMAVLFVDACSKDKKNDDKNVTPVTKTEMLAGKWITTAIMATEVYNGQTTVDDEFSGEDECDKDDLTIYAADGTVKYDEGATKCDPDDPQVYSEGTWVFIENETRIAFDSDGYKDTADVKELTETSLVLAYVMKDDSIKVTNEYTLKKVN